MNDPLQRHHVGLIHLLIAATLLFMAGCTPPSVTQGLIKVSILADGKTIPLQLPSGASVQYALEVAGVKPTGLDRVHPPAYSILADQTEIRLTRVREEFEIVEKTLEFENQTIYNESIPTGQTLLVQPGINGVQQITYRLVFEDNVQISRSEFKNETIKESQPEIIMVGVQNPYRAIEIPGKLAYLSAGNAWIMEGNTSERRPLITSGDLDGRIFSLSPDGSWLLFTRKSSQAAGDEINQLWIVSTDKDAKAYSLNVKNIVHYAEWIPDKNNSISYSTVEPRTLAPGWQANNDLFILTFDPLSGKVTSEEEILAANSGGIYGWWGTTFAWASDGKRLAYARPDSIGLVRFEEVAEIQPLLDLLPLNTRSDWAWVPGIAWSPDQTFIFTVTHAPLAGISDPETSPLFNLSAVGISESIVLDCVFQTGMFAYPSPSPLMDDRFIIAYLQANFPNQSDSSSYRLMIMDRDGSNRKTIFPPEGGRGLEPQKVNWSPSSSETQAKIALVFSGNLWLIQSNNWEAQQITGDGSILKIDWK